jgi:hypothetical protein
MFKQMQKVLAGVAALAAIGFGASALAQAGSTSTPAKAPAVTQPATGGQSEQANGPDTDQVQSGDQSGPDNEKADANETPDANEAAGSETPNDDGPGGHADEAGGAADQEVAGK